MVARNSSPSTLAARKADHYSDGARTHRAAPRLAVPKLLYVPVVSVNTWLLRDHPGPPELSRFDALLDLGPYGKLITSRFIQRSVEVEEQCDISLETLLSAPESLVSSPL